MPISFVIKISNTEKNNIVVYRYKDDLHDRLWEPYSNNQWTELSGSLTNDNIIERDDFDLPAVVMSTAVTPTDANAASLDFYWDADNATDQYYFYMHFLEVQKLAANETRAFNIFLNGKYWYGVVEPTYGQTETIRSRSAGNGAGNGYNKNNISLVQTLNSTLPPIISALEIYVVKDFSQLETEEDDGMIFI